MDDETKIAFKQLADKFIELAGIVESLANEMGLTYSNDLRMLVSKKKFEELKKNPK